MREALSKLEGQRCAWTATFVRYGSKPGFQGAPAIPTVLVRDVKDVLGHVVADHLWFTETVEMKACALELGVEVAFDARVTRYRKGLEKELIDFRLSHATGFRVKAAPALSREWRSTPGEPMPTEQLGLFG